MAGDLLMAARYAELAAYKEELIAMGNRLFEIVDTELGVGQIDPRLGLPVAEEAVSEVPNASVSFADLLRAAAETEGGA